MRYRSDSYAINYPPQADSVNLHHRTTNLGEDQSKEDLQVQVEKPKRKPRISSAVARGRDVTSKAGSRYKKKHDDRYKTSQRG